MCCTLQHGNSEDYKTVSNYLYDLIISSCGEWNSCCQGFVSVVRVVILMWKWATGKAVILLSVCWQTAGQRCWLVVTGFIAHLMCMAVCFQLLCQCKHEYMQVTTWSFHLNLQERSHFVDVESPCTAYSVNDNSSFFNAWLLNIMGLSLLSCEL